MTASFCDGNRSPSLSDITENQRSIARKFGAIRAFELKRPRPANHYSFMSPVRQMETQYQLRIHRFAVQLYETLVERVGIHHEETQLALRLVEATDPDGSDVTVTVRRGKLAGE